MAAQPANFTGFDQPNWGKHLSPPLLAAEGFDQEAAGSPAEGTLPEGREGTSAVRFLPGWL